VATFFGFWVSTLPASDFVLELVRPSLRTLPAVRAVVDEDCLTVPACASALPASDFAVLLAPGSRSTDEAVRVTLGPDCSRLDIGVPFRGGEGRHAASTASNRSVESELLSRPQYALDFDRDGEASSKSEWWSERRRAGSAIRGTALARAPASPLLQAPES
jgi:hypothetical protein